MYSTDAANGYHVFPLAFQSMATLTATARGSADFVNVTDISGTTFWFQIYDRYDAGEVLYGYYFIAIGY